MGFARLNNEMPGMDEAVAERADTVVRPVAGIPIRLKADRPQNVIIIKT